MTIRRRRNKGLDAANRYAKIAPDAPHAQHMPSHIYTRVGYWKESIASNWSVLKPPWLTNRWAITCTRRTIWSMPTSSWPGQAGARRHRRHGKETDFKADNRSCRLCAGRCAGPLCDRAWRLGGRLQLPVRQSNLNYAMAVSHFARSLGAARSGNRMPPRPTSRSSPNCVTACARPRIIIGPRTSTFNGRWPTPGCFTPKASTTRRSEA